MEVDQGYSGQESDVNRACSAFGLDTVNYRAFPHTGPVPVQPTTVKPVSLPDPAAEQTISLPASTQPNLTGVHLPNPVVQEPPPSPAQTAPQPAAPPPYIPQIPPQPSYVPQMAPPPYPYAPPLPPQAPPPLETGSFAGSFSLLSQALPTASPAPAPAQTMAFAMARVPLQPIPYGNAGIAQSPASPATSHEAFGAAFAVAFKAAFGNAPAAAAPPPPPVPAAPDLLSVFQRSPY